MHEYSVVRALLDRVEAEARSHGAVAVHRILVRIGDSAGVERDLFATAYAVFREHTLCENARLEIEGVATRWQCPHCDASIAIGGLLRCLACGVPARLVAGDEIILERVEMEVP